MLRTIFRQAVQVVPTLLAITILVFLMIHMIPGDPAVLMAGLESSPEVVERIRADLGLDQPLYIQFWRFLSGAVRTTPVVAIAPGVAITLVVLAFSVAGDGLRDALDPK